jgi:uncharacterized membrane protein
MNDFILQNADVWRQRILAGEVLPPEEMRAAIQAIRKERIGATAVSATAKIKRVSARQKLEAIDSDKLLNSFF